MRVLVLGGTGFIGPHAIRRLADRGHDVLVFHRGETESELAAAATHVHGDFADFDDHVDELASWEPEVVVDLAARTAEEGRRVRRFKGVVGRGIVASSADVYRAFGRGHRTEPGPPDPVPLTEDSPLREKVVVAGRDKVGVEREAQTDPDFPVTILRLPATHGPGDPYHRLFEYVKRMDDGRPTILLEETLARWHWVRGYVKNVGDAVALAAEDKRAAGRIYNVADPIPYTEAEWVRLIGAAVGWNGTVVPVPDSILPDHLRLPADFTQDYSVDSSRIRAELDYNETVPEEEALARTIEWERANPPADVKPEEFDYAAEDAALARVT
jgi:nucleoside-diphosphate-sugar epimerase